MVFVFLIFIMPEDNKSKKVLVSVTPEQYKQLAEEAEKEFRTVSNMVTVLLFSALGNRKEEQS